MPDNSYRITPQWKDLLVYDEGAGRRIEFDAGIMEEPYWVTIPAAVMWTQRTPAWAHDRREIIIDRLRASGCIIEEYDAKSRTLFSPDGLFRIWMGLEDDYPAPPRNMIRIISMSDDAVIATLADSQISGPIQFPGRGRVKLPFRSNDQRCEPEFDIPARTFRVGTDEAKPIESITTMFVSTAPAQKFPSPQTDALYVTKRKGPRILSAIGWLTVSLAFTIGSIMLLLRADGPFEILMSLMGCVLFGYGSFESVRWCRTLLNSRSFPPGHCKKCGYNLRGNASGGESRF